MRRVGKQAQLARSNSSREPLINFMMNNPKNVITGIFYGR